MSFKRLPHIFEVQQHSGISVISDIDVTGKSNMAAIASV